MIISFIQLINELLAHIESLLATGLAAFEPLIALMATPCVPHLCAQQCLQDWCADPLGVPDQAKTQSM